MNSMIERPRAFIKPEQNGNIFSFIGRFSILACLAVLCGMTISCGGQTTPVKDTPAKATPAIIEEGWVSDTEFRVKVSADAETSATDSLSLQKSSESAASKKARETVVKNFVILRMKQSPSVSSYAVAALSIDREFRDIIEHGKVIAKEFESGNRRCLMVYQVEGKNLRKNVEQGNK
jgi:hypothetical protein